MATTAYTGALGILQSEILATATKIRNARLAGVPAAERSHKAALFALLRVRKTLRLGGVA